MCATRVYSCFSQMCWGPITTLIYGPLHHLFSSSCLGYEIELVVTVQV